MQVAAPRSTAGQSVSRARGVAVCNPTINDLRSLLSAHRGKKLLLTKGNRRAAMSRLAIAVGLGLTYCVVTVAWCFVLIKAVVWLSGGIAVFAHSISREADVVINRPVFVHHDGDGQRVRSPIWW